MIHIPHGRRHVDYYTEYGLIAVRGVYQWKGWLGRALCHVFGIGSLNENGIFHIFYGGGGGCCIIAILWDTDEKRRFLSSN